MDWHRECIISLCECAGPGAYLSQKELIMWPVTMLLLLIAALAIVFGSAGVGLNASSAQVTFFIFLALLLIALFALVVRHRRVDPV